MHSYPCCRQSFDPPSRCVLRGKMYRWSLAKAEFILGRRTSEHTILCCVFVRRKPLLWIMTHGKVMSLISMQLGPTRPSTPVSCIGAYKPIAHYSSAVMESTPDVDGVGSTLPPLPCLRASELILRDCSQAYHDVRRLASILRMVKLDSRREDLLDYIRLNRARFIRAYVAVRWLSGRHGDLVVNACKALTEARAQREQIDTCQDQFFFMHGGLFGARQRLYDIPVAVDVLVRGGYPWLPKGIEYCGGDLDPRPFSELSADRKEIIMRVERAIRLALLRRGGIPSQFTSHSIRDGVLILAVRGEFELTITLQAESANAQWILQGIQVKIQTREGESVAAPPTNLRQQSYLHEVVQKVMYTHYVADEATSDPLVAAYQVCHDLCCGMIMEILHAQAQKLATRIGGLWANQLKVFFDKEKQVLDLCIWHGEFRTGLAGTGRDVGITGVHADDDALLHRQSATGGTEAAVAHDLPVFPVGCRYIRVHRPVDMNGQIVGSLGPVEDLFQSHAVEGGEDEGTIGTSFASGEEQAAAVILDAVQVQPDRLSCGQMLLAAGRAFAAQKVQALASDLEEMARKFGVRYPSVSVVNGSAACLHPWGDGSMAVTVDVKSGRYIIQDTLSRSSKVMARCMSRFGEALNLMPRTDTQGLSAMVAAAMATGGTSSSVWPLSAKPPYDEEQDLRQQQVRRYMAESLKLLRRAEVEHVWRCAFGMMPSQRWQALLGRADTMLADVDADASSNEGLGTLRSFVCLGQFRENGVQLSDDWRRRRRSGRLRRRGLGVIELTNAERAATVSRVPEALSASGLLNSNAMDPLSHTLSLSNDLLLGNGALPGLAASLVDGSDVDDLEAPRPPLGATEQNHVTVAQAGSDIADCGHVHQTDEELSFFLEAAVTAKLSIEHTLIVATLSTVAEGKPSFRPKVSETYHIRPCPPQSSSSFSRGGTLLPVDPMLSVVGSASILGKRPARDLNASGARRGETDSTGGKSILTNSCGVDGSLHARSIASNPFDQAPDPEWWRRTNNPPYPMEMLQVHEAVEVAKSLVPYARLQHALTRVGTGITLDVESFTHLSSPSRQVSHCAVLLAGEKGWLSPQLAATSALVRSLPGHSQLDSWEWHVTLSLATQAMNYMPGSGVSTRDAAVCQLLPLVNNVEIGFHSGVDGQYTDRKDDRESAHYESVEGSAKLRQKAVRFRFPASFSVHAMCRSFALAGEGLAAMVHIASQAAKMLQAGTVGDGYSVVSCSPMHIALCDASCGHLVVLTHSAFSAACISCAGRPELVLLPQPDRCTCPAALREFEASVRKHLDLHALLHGLSRTLPVLQVVAEVIPGVGHGTNAPSGAAESVFVLSAVSPACYVLSDSCPNDRRETLNPLRPALTLLVEAGGCVRVSAKGREDVVANTIALRKLLLDWIAATPPL